MTALAALKRALVWQGLAIIPGGCAMVAGILGHEAVAWFAMCLAFLASQQAVEVLWRHVRGEVDS